VPGSDEEELRSYLECGILCFGFARARCTGCGQGFVVAFSCKGRGVCPSCNGRHMTRDRRESCRSRDSAGALAAVGELGAEAIAGHACRPSRQWRTAGVPAGAANHPGWPGRARSL